MRLVFAVLACLIASNHEAAARSNHIAGQFDFYVLALSWSPSYCEAQGPRASRTQCGGGRPYAFIVHGLWPQYERGFPQFCPRQPRHVPNQLARTMFDLMPSYPLIRHEWEKHGTCSGLTQQRYFAKLRAARKKVVIPEGFVDPRQYRMVSTIDVERAFQASNPGLPADAIAVTCDRRRMREVRICFTKDLKFRTCPNVDRNACRNPRIAVPPVR